MTKINICIATCGRPEPLSALLDSLARLELSPALAPGLAIIVIDNNPDGSALDILEMRVDAGFPWPLRYVQEPRPGVSHVRNRALELSETADFLAFVDDDELVHPKWLAALLSAQEESGAAVVVGPVHARYSRAAPAWIQEGDFHSIAVPQSGPRDLPAYTSNCLIRMSDVRSCRLRFAEWLSLIGGEDTLFFSLLKKRGATFWNAAEAMVYEPVVAPRATLNWLVKRWFRTGYSDAVVTRYCTNGTHPGLTIFWGGSIRILYGFMKLIGVFLRRGFTHPASFARCLYTIARGSGMIAFASGVTYYEYARKQEPSLSLPNQHPGARASKAVSEVHGRSHRAKI